MNSLPNDALFSAALWDPALEKYAADTHATVNLFDTGAHRVLGPINRTPLFRLFEKSGYNPGLFAECARRCLVQTGERSSVMVSEAHGLAVVGVSLVVDEKIVGAAVAGYVFVDFSQVSEIEGMARQAGIGFEELWLVAREQIPVPQSRLILNGELLQVLGDAILKANCRTRQYEDIAANLERIVDERTAALRELSTSLLRAQDDQSRKIARELHDSLGQYLACAKMNVAVLQKAPIRVQDAKIVSELKDTLEKCISETRTMSYLLHPPLLDEMGFRSAALWYVEGFSKRSGIRININVPGEHERIIESPATELALFRVLQETLTNCHRYSGTQSVDVDLEIDAEEVTLRVKDYGKGIPPGLLERFKSTGHGTGVGLNGMRARVTELGGRFEIESDTTGTVVRAAIPLSPTRVAAAAGQGA